MLKLALCAFVFSKCLGLLVLAASLLCFRLSSVCYLVSSSLLSWRSLGSCVPCLRAFSASILMVSFGGVGVNLCKCPAIHGLIMIDFQQALVIDCNRQFTQVIMIPFLPVAVYLCLLPLLRFWVVLSVSPQRTLLMRCCCEVGPCLMSIASLHWCSGICLRAARSFSQLSGCAAIVRSLCVSDL